MTQGIQYDAAWCKRVEQIYSTSDVAAQRGTVLRALELRPGEAALDIGCGPGFLTAAIAQEIGAAGRVQGLDLSEAMVEMAQARCAGLCNVTFRTADAGMLPFADASFDVAASTQVYEYVGDVPRALNDLFRVLRPGGRAVILDTAWDSLVWHSRDRLRAKRVLEIFDTHCAHPQLATRLASLLRGAGFAVAPPEVFCILNPRLHEDTYSHGIIDFIASYVLGTEQMAPGEVTAWAEDLIELGARNEYFFSLNRYLFRAHRP